jgi:hypothetical protein
MKTNIILQPICLLAALALASGAAQAIHIQNVNCNDGETISSKLNIKKFKERTITIKGTCNESPTVIQDDVTLKSDPSSPNATINGTLTFDGAARFHVEDLIVTGPGSGINVLNGASGSIHDSTITGNVNGIGVGRGAFAHIENTIIEDSGTDDDGGFGLEVFTGGVATGLNNTMRGNKISALDVFQNGTYRSSFDTISKDTTNETAWAIEISRDSFVELRDADVTGPVFLFTQSQLHTRRSTYTGSISANEQSLVQVLGHDPGTTVTGDINVGPQASLSLTERADGPITVDGDVNVSSLSHAEINATVTGSVNCDGSSICIP